MSSPPSSPTASHDENIPPLNPNASRDELLKIARRYQVEHNSAQAELKRLTRKLDDITNQSDNSPGPSKRRKVTNRPARSHSNYSDDDDDSGDDISSRQSKDDQIVEKAGHKFCLIHCLWLHSGDELFDTKLDDDYEPAERFENDHNKVQGQLREVAELLRDRFDVSSLHKRWLRRQFLQGMSQQRHNTASRIRHRCGSILGISEADMLKPEVRRDRFRGEIGWVAATGKYSSLNVPILHEQWNGEYSLSSVFLNKKLMGVYVTLIRGPHAGRHFMSGELIRPHTETMDRIHHIRNITPGAIATCSVLARWALSSDDTLQQVGSSTGIQYLKDYEEYLIILEKGLRDNKKSIINVIKVWDSKIFPDSDCSIVKKSKDDDGSELQRALDQLDADSEGETEKEDNGEDNPEGTQN
ncbi:hypothetical protein BJ165DRAFT_1533821 [Panaeolus papilionaceus]|nr:hypothetical protein BJ165DRAFT_1533821 [Panaeolus papilionaceus]